MESAVAHGLCRVAQRWPKKETRSREKGSKRGAADFLEALSQEPLTAVGPFSVTFWPSWLGISLRGFAQMVKERIIERNKMCSETKLSVQTDVKNYAGI